jgi:heptosyltransferase-1
MRAVLVRLSALGDVVHTWPLADALRAARPDLHLTWAVEEPLAPLVVGHPAVDAVITTATRRWRQRPLTAATRAEVAILRGRFQELQPDLAIDAQGTVKSALITRWTRAPRRVGLARPWRRELLAGLAYTETVPGDPDRPHVVATTAGLTRALVRDPLPPAPAPDGRWLLERAAATAPTWSWPLPFAVVLPGAGQPDKILGEPLLAEVSRQLVAFGFSVVVAWGPAEHGRARRVTESAGSSVYLAPATDLLELTALLGSAALVIGGDTGPVHLAASLGVPTLAVFLTTDAIRNRPLGPIVGVVSGAAPGRGPGGSAATGPARPVTLHEITAAITDLLGSQE